MGANVFLIGAPKCGTSSLYSWIAAHPGVEGSQPKETFYFVDPDHPLRRKDGGFYTLGLRGFERFFERSRGHAGLRLEATTHHLYQERTPALFEELFPEARVVVLLRDPVKRLMSAFNYAKNNQAAIDNRLTFPAFASLLLEHRQQELRPFMSSEQRYRLLVHELSRSEYLPHLLRWRSRPGLRLRVVQFERMAADPLGELRGLAEWLGLDPDFYEGFGFARRNETRAIRWRGLHRVARQVRIRLGPRKMFRIVRGAYYGLQRATSVESRDPAIVEALYAHFSPLNARLADEFPLDLSLWRPELT